MLMFEPHEECSNCKCLTCEYRNKECTCEGCTGVRENPEDLMAFFVSMYARCLIKEELNEAKRKSNSKRH